MLLKQVAILLHSLNVLDQTQKHTTIRTYKIIFVIINNFCGNMTEEYGYTKSFIESQFPVSKISKESYKERKAGGGQILTGVGKW